MTDTISTHLKSLNLTGNPFPLTPDAANHFVSDALAVYMVEILHTIKARKGFILITGEVGVGKSTLSRRLMDELHGEAVETALILNTFLQGASLLEAMNEDFGIDKKGKNIHESLKLLNSFLLQRHAAGVNCVVIIDDAQNLDPVSLELVRQLTNLETGQEKLVQVLLISQPEISDVLDRHDLRQLKSRIALHVQLLDFSLQETYQYIAFRLKRFGGGITLTRRALNVLHKASQGYPRLINKLMDRCLYGLVSSNKREISVQLMRMSVEELHLGSKAGSSAMRFIYAFLAVGMIVLLTFSWWSNNPAMAKMLAALSSSDQPRVDVVQRDAVSVKLHSDSFQAVAASSGLHAMASAGDTETLHTTLEQKRRMKLSVSIQHDKKALTLMGKPLSIAIQKDTKPVVIKKAISQPQINIAEQAKSTEHPVIHGVDVDIFKSTPVAKISRDMRYGATSIYTENIQYFLKQMGFYYGNVDGIIGNRTVLALASFQKSQSLSPTGSIDEQTMRVILDLLELKK